MRVRAVGILAATTATVVGASLYFADGIREYASAFLVEKPASEFRPAPIPARQSTGPPTVIGKWEDRIGTSWAREIQIVVQAGYVVRQSRLPDGRTDRDILTEVTPHAGERRRFENLSSTRGEAYAITRHGHLAIFDEDGFVHQAMKVTTPGERR